MTFPSLISLYQLKLPAFSTPASHCQLVCGQVLWTGTAACVGAPCPEQGLSVQKKLPFEERLARYFTPNFRVCHS